MEVIEQAFISLHQATGESVPLDQLKFLVCQLSVIPLGLLVTLTPASWVKPRHWMSIFISIFLMSISINEWCFVHSLFTSCVTYIMVWKLPPNYSPICVFVFAMGYMAISHMYRMYWDWGGWHIDFTASQMIVTLKLISFAYCYSDGFDPEGFRDYQLEHKLTTLPTSLEFFGYIYFFPSFLCGPPIEMSDYLKWADYSMFPQKKIPSRILASLKQMILSFLFLVPVFISLQYPPSLLLTEEFDQLHFVVRCFLCVVVLIVFRSKYYMLWWLSEAGYIACGFAYLSSKDGSFTWTRTKNVYPLDCEFGDSVQVKTKAWNIKVSDWLFNYVYMRVMPGGPRKPKPGARRPSPPLYVTMCTYAVSAFWHGFYPGYYFFFLTFGVLDQLARRIRVFIRPYFLPEDSLKKKVYDIVCVCMTNAVANYLGLSFVVLDLSGCLVWWGKQYYWGHLLTFGSFFALTVYGMVASPPKTKTN